MNNDECVEVDSKDCAATPCAPEDWTEYETGDDDDFVASQWQSLGNGSAYVSSESSAASIPPGQYDMIYNHQIGKPMFVKKTVNLDDLIALPDSASEEVVAAVEVFWTKKEKFKEMGFLFKRGILLWGPPGSGKTSTVQTVAANIVKSGGVAMYMDNPSFATEALQHFREVEPERPLVVMAEDIDSIVDKYGDHELLALLDGELNIENVLFIATTNYPEQLDARIVNRPSRFDIVKLIPMPSQAAREIFLKVKLPDRFAGKGGRAELNTWVKLTDGFSVAHLKEIIISVEGFGYTVESTVTRLRRMMDSNPSSEDIELNE